MGHSRQSGIVNSAHFVAPEPEPVVAQAAKNSMIARIENKAVVLLFMKSSFSSLETKLGL